MRPCSSATTTTTTITTITSRPPRPRLLYSALFTYVAVTGGRFMAPFLEHEAHFSDTMIGATLAMQTAIMSLCSSVGGSYADEQERKYPLRGHAQVMLYGISCGNVVFLLHGLGYIFPSWNWLQSPVWHVTLRCLYAGSAAMVFPVLDGLTLAHLEREESSFNYGKERLHGAIWWAVACLIIGPLVDSCGFVVMYPLALLTTAACYFTIYVYVQGQQQSATGASLSQDEAARRQLQQLHRRNKRHRLHAKQSSVVDDEQQMEDSPKNQQATSTNRRFSTSELVGILLGSIYNIGFFVSTLLLSSGTAVVDSLIFLYFEDLGGSNTMCGITVALTVMFEIPIFHIAPTLLQRFGPGRLLQVANVAYVTRVIGYTLIPPGRSYFVILLEPLHGVTYACFQSSAVELIAQIMPVGYEATGQGLLGLWKGIGSVAGLWLGGLTEDQLGARTMYRIFALNVTIGTIIFGVLSQIGGRQFQQVPADGRDDPSDEDGEIVADDEAQVELCNM